MIVNLEIVSAISKVRIGQINHRDWKMCLSSSGEATWKKIMDFCWPVSTNTFGHQVFMDISLDDEKLGRIVFGLYGKQVPKTVRIPGISRYLQVFGLRQLDMMRLMRLFDFEFTFFRNRCASKSLTGWLGTDHVQPFGYHNLSF